MNMIQTIKKGNDNNGRNENNERNGNYARLN